MHVAKIVRPYKDRVYVYHFVRQTYREDGRVKHRTLANLSHLPPAVIELVRRALAGDPLALEAADGPLEVRRSLPHGHVAAVLGMLRSLGLETLLGPGPGRAPALVAAMVVARICDPASKLATAGRLADSTLAERLGVTDASPDELYTALDWLLGRQPAVEAALAARHLGPGSLVLYDVSSTYVTGRACELAAHGYSRDHRADREQVVFGLVCDPAGRPLAVEAFPGNTADPATLETALDKLQRTFGLSDIVLAGDRGMLTSARIERLKERGGIGWISALRAPAIRGLVESGALQLGLFDERDLAEIASPDFPGERLVVCRNPVLAAERTRKRDALLGATERELERVVHQVERGRLRSPAAIGLRVGRILDRAKMAKHFELTISEGAFGYARKETAIAAEAALDGLYVLRTSVPAERLPAPSVVTAYKSLAHAERAFRNLKTVELEVRPIYHYKADRVRAHLFVCLLAAYVGWHLERALAPLLFRDEAPPVRVDPVAPAPRSAAARRKDRRQRTSDEELPVGSFRTLLRHLATLTENRIAPRGADEAAAYTQLTLPTPLQARAFELLGFAPGSV
ncbi:MAG: transposase [Chloroflexi bacterium CSP1-4]|nr:MAG: transposase [Chloroflexi bacterium CSP1-4]